MASLTQTEATERAATITVEAYRVDLDLTAEDLFRSVTIIAFTASPGRATFLDVKPEVLHSVVLNGQPVDVTALRDGRLPLAGLTQSNEIVVIADMAYSQQCEGLHRFVDPADGAVYIYAFAYIDNAPRVFACFDQPDLKAPYTFTLTTPHHWRVLGNSDATEVSPGRWRTTPSSPQPPYLTTVLAGPYAAFHRDHNGVRLGLNCRASRAADLAGDIDEIFEITGQCLDFYQDLFGVAYPFGKLDQAFVPEFSVLSLDHPGCILIRELYLFGSAVPASERETRAVVIAHGLSLMWLAGLVTNRWWNDLWFGEAFADYIGHRATSEVTRFPGPLTTFAVRRKAEAYVADQRPSTHPVALSSQDVQSALLDLDRISYFKGSSVLRQLATRVGTDALRAGLRTYFERHAYGSGSFADFLRALSEAIGTDLTDWVDVWFRQPGVTTLRSQIAVVDDRITGATIHQSGPVPRPHTLHIGLYGPAGDAHETVRVQVDGARTELPELVGRPAPDLVLVNEDDLTYATVLLDGRSAAVLPDLLPRLSALNRAMVWCGLLMAVRDGAYPATDYLDLAARMLAEESELCIIVEVLEHIRDEVAGRYLDPALRPDYTGRLAAVIRARLSTTSADDERQVALARGLVEFSADAAELRDWLDGRGPTPADFDLAWRIRYRLAVLGELSEAQLDKALAAAPSAHAEQMAAKARAGMPDAAVKAAVWTAVMTDTGLSSYHRWALAEGFWQPDQVELTSAYAERFFTEIPDVARSQGDLALGQLMRFFYPRFSARAETLRHSEKLMGRSDVSAALRRKVADATDDLRRVVAARESACG